jgi:hypothetical protein
MRIFPVLMLLFFVSSFVSAQPTGRIFVPRYNQIALYLTNHYAVHLSLVIQRRDFADVMRQVEMSQQSAALSRFLVEQLQSLQPEQSLEIARNHDELARYLWRLREMDMLPEPDQDAQVLHRILEIVWTQQPEGKSDLSTNFGQEHFRWNHPRNGGGSGGGVY